MIQDYEDRVLIYPSYTRVNHVYQYHRPFAHQDLPGFRIHCLYIYTRKNYHCILSGISNLLTNEKWATI
jgi:hypothetical protein